MTDRELLARAAAAYFGDAPKHIGVGVLDWVRDCIGEWNPLTDDGDALRLAVKLKMFVDVTREATGTQIVNVAFCSELHNNTPCPDPYAATRRAIVRAAAEIGKVMP